MGLPLRKKRSEDRRRRLMCSSVFVQSNCASCRVGGPGGVRQKLPINKELMTAFSPVRWLYDAGGNILLKAAGDTHCCGSTFFAPSCLNVREPACRSLEARGSRAVLLENICVTIRDLTH